MNNIADISVISGYFNPMHIGHLRLIQAAKKIGPHLVVIVNNDVQQELKKGRIIMPEEDRLEIVSELKSVDRALLAVDEDPTVIKSLRLVRELYPRATIAFCNGGDRSTSDDVPTQESQVCAELEIEMCYGVGGTEKLDSSTRITSSQAS
ncbi:adenylyltransferase/cytidyltransferase family protein [Catellatospora sichuanensis]|uniref:adenylyltransferase/cytidyltransferase family protein n=1 Tax=Catellatospora sichuanensis TaxID=1969805 RepID=UPI0011840C61|nr:adenylyltransferase/cytidyltransferase family protein [Catellatospora sichuanensis]